MQRHTPKKRKRQIHLSFSGSVRKNPGHLGFHDDKSICRLGSFPEKFGREARGTDFLSLIPMYTARIGLTRSSGAKELNIKRKFCRKNCDPDFLQVWVPGPSARVAQARAGHNPSDPLSRALPRRAGKSTTEAVGATRATEGQSGNPRRTSGPLERRAHPLRRHGELEQPRPGGVEDGVGYHSARGDDSRLARTRGRSGRVVNHEGFDFGRP